MKQSYDELARQLRECLDELDRTKLLLKAALDKISKLEEENTKLEEQLNKNSKNSSKPPSTDFKSNKVSKNEKRREGRKGVSRTPFPKERVDGNIDCTLDHCTHCGSSSLASRDVAEIHQQVELPEVRAIVTEYHLQKYECRDCGKRCSAQLPLGTPNSVFGVNLMALVATLTGAYQLSKRDALQLIDDIYGIEIGLGSIPNIEKRVTGALDPIYERIHHFVVDSHRVKHLDETGWRDSGIQHYVWIAATQEASLFRIDRHRSQEAFERLVGSERQFNAVTDRYAVYKAISGVHQYCLAHLIREFRCYGERDGPDGEIGGTIKQELQGVCKVHAEYRRGERTLKSRNQSIGHKKKRIEDALIDGYADGSDDLSGLCDRLLDEEQHLYAFTRIDGMEPTNNLAERNLRRIVLFRKKSYGTKSENGKRFVERITTITQTARAQCLNVLTFVRDAVLSYYRDAEAPLIRPIYGF
jgi:transposase